MCRLYGNPAENAARNLPPKMTNMGQYTSAAVTVTRLNCVPFFMMRLIRSVFAHRAEGILQRARRTLAMCTVTIIHSCAHPRSALTSEHHRKPHRQEPRKGHTRRITTIIRGNSRINAQRDNRRSQNCGAHKNQVEKDRLRTLDHT